MGLYQEKNVDHNHHGLKNDKFRLDHHQPVEFIVDWDDTSGPMTAMTVKIKGTTLDWNPHQFSGVIPVPLTARAKSNLYLVTVHSMPTRPRRATPLDDAESLTTTMTDGTGTEKAVGTNTVTVS